jgi:outer membrane protein OmpA-like peptidoglycan-associated protein
MKSHRIVQILFLFLQVQTSFSQKTPNLHTPHPGVINHGDCISSSFVSLDRSISLHNTAPSGPGQMQEVNPGGKNKNLFDQEHNVCWYKFRTKYEGIVTLDIIPEDSTNDYDFILYKGDSTSFCEKFANGLIEPLRSNVSRIDRSLQGRTGLSLESKSAFVGKGIGQAYSKALQVLPNEWYYLVLDNVYPNGKGYTLNGTIKGTDSTLLKAEYSLTDQFGNTILNSKTSNGIIQINAQLKYNQEYDLNIGTDGHFFDIQTISTLKNEDKISIRSILPELKKGRKFTVKTINFCGNNALFLSNSKSSLEALYRILKRNPTLKIQIEGHVNDCNPAPGIDIQKLSELRAEAVVNYCVKKGISSDRLEAVGYGCAQMIFPDAKTEYEQMMNRRVEVNVLKL